MSKSIFDKLFEDVMGVDGADTEAKDALDLGVGAEAGHEAEGGDVTFTLPRDLARKLCDVLHEVLETGTEETAEHETGDESEDAEDHSKDAEQMVAGEATELTEVKPAAGLSLTGKNNKVGDETAKLVAKGGGDGKVKSEVDGKGTDEGHALVGSGVKGGAPTSPKGKANVVAGKASNVGSYLFQK